MEVAEGVHRQTMGIVNWYVVEDGGRLTLVDAGTPHDWQLLLQALTTLGRQLDDVEAVLLTHTHSDHTGFAERARTEAHATVHVHSADAGRARGEQPPSNEAGLWSYLLRVQAYKTSFRLLRRGASKVIPIAQVATFEDGETIDVPGHPRAVLAPGHTAGSAALWFEQRGALCTGDALVTWNPLTGRDGPQIMPAAFNIDSGQALRSLDDLEAFSEATVLPGHGDPWTAGGAAEAVRRARLAGRS